MQCATPRRTKSAWTVRVLLLHSVLMFVSVFYAFIHIEFSGIHTHASYLCRSHLWTAC